jgi:outer membrane protein OmpA-like peptidoglycan-associated protein
MRAIVLLCYWLLGGSVFAQTNDINATGKIVNAITGKGVKAKIFYKSLPTGGITGRINDSTYTFTIFGTAKYQVMAEAPGFLPGTAIIDPKDINSEHQVVRNITLTPEGQTVELQALNFELGKAVITADSYPGLDELVAMMKENQKMVIQLEGHTDIAGDPKLNMKLSQDRVEAVQKYLVSKGLAKSRIKTKAFGGTKPLTRDRSEDGQKKNRRVEMRVLEH